MPTSPSPIEPGVTSDLNRAKRHWPHSIVALFNRFSSSPPPHPADDHGWTSSSHDDSSTSRWGLPLPPSSSTSRPLSLSSSNSLWTILYKPLPMRGENVWGFSTNLETHKLQRRLCNIFFVPPPPPFCIRKPPPTCASTLFRPLYLYLHTRINCTYPSTSSFRPAHTPIHTSHLSSPSPSSSFRHPASSLANIIFLLLVLNLPFMQTRSSSTQFFPAFLSLSNSHARRHRSRLVR
jgi:hypothetical protein